MSLLIDFDSWSTDVEACENLHHKLLTNLAQRDKRQRLSPEYSLLSASIQNGLNHFESHLEQLKGKLDGVSKSGEITFDETERRQRHLDSLWSQLQQMRTKFKSTTLQDRTALLEQPASSQSPWQQTTNTTTKDPPQNYGTAQNFNANDIASLKRQQIDLLEEQNSGLEVLSQTISRQRAMTQQLGLEIEDQNEILDHLSNTMDRVDTQVNVETGNIGLINRQDSTWGYWLVIIVLLVAIVVVALL